MSARLEAGYSPNSIRIMRTVLRRALGQAEREGIVPRNVAKLSGAPRIRAKEGRTLTVDQARRLLDAAAGYRFEVAVVLALAYGMRRGEVLGLHWSALDWQTGTLRVTHGVKRVKDRDVSSGRRTRLVVSELKTPKSRRTLVLTPELASRFRQHRARQAKAQMAAGSLWQDHGLIFASEVGTPMDPDNFSHSSSGCASGPGSVIGIRTSYVTRAPRRLGPGHAVARGLRGARARQHRNHQGRVRASARRGRTGGGGVDEPGSVRWSRYSRGSQRGSQNNKKAPGRAGEGPVSWAGHRQNSLTCVFGGILGVLVPG